MNIIQNASSLLVVFLLSYGWVASGETSSVLVLHPMHSPSHVLALRTLISELAHRGHQVTVVRPYDRNLPPLSNKNVSEYLVSIDNRNQKIPMMTQQNPAQFQMPMSEMWEDGTSLMALPLAGYSVMSAYCHQLLSDLHLRAVLFNSSFQLALVDLIYNECGLALAHHLGLPVVGYWAFSFAGGEPQYTTAFNPPAATPLILSHLSDRMTFFGRVWNHVLLLCNEIVMQVTFWTANQHIRKHFPTCPSPQELLANMSGVLINSHPAIDYPRQFPPSFLEVGGFHIKNPEVLPKHLAILTNSAAKHGVILFSLGFTFDTNFVPSEVISAYLEAFGRLRQSVIMVAKGPIHNYSIPRNVHIIQWVPQGDILAHHNTVLFVSHCGMHGVLEAITHAVPMVGIPVFADQRDVLVRLVGAGVAVGLDKQASANEVYSAITEVLYNFTYRQRAQDVSRILSDHTSSPLSRAVWLVEHTITTRGAEHLKMSSRHLSLLQYLGIDVIVFFLCLIALTFVTFISIPKAYLKVTSSGKKEKEL
ncbi:UDP-glucuronosyl/UDP-glucosyltransferase [Trinorchestia longiramus]|nr:UDP-glucuronosyl/UDP-glucosyltransferase [Trinorchestia longiramus]